MRLSRAHGTVNVLVPALALAVALALSGCVSNMPELKDRLGVKEKVVPEAYVPPPVLEPPVAKARANATTVLTGAPVRFLSEGTRDPHGLALQFHWDFGDARKADGPVATHSYDAPGEYVVRLHVINADGLTDEDTIPMRVSLGNRAPVAAFRVLDAQGEDITITTCGTKLAFDAAGSSDADGQPLSYEWDLGDGATPHDARVTHAYAKPGAFLVKLIVADPAGARAESSRLVRVGCAFTASGSLAPTDNAASFAFPIARDAASLVLTLKFPSGMGVNDLQLVVKDAKGADAGASSGATAPGAQDDQTRTVTLDAKTLAALAAGDWTAQIVKKQGIQATWALDIVEAV